MFSTVRYAFSGTRTALWSIDEENQLGAEEYPVTFHAHYEPLVRKFKIQIRAAWLPVEFSGRTHVDGLRGS